LRTEEKIAFDRLETLAYLPFDSGVFGFPFFRLPTVPDESLSRDLESLRNLNLPVFGCDAKVSALENSDVRHLQEEGFVHVCDQVTFEVSPASSDLRLDGGVTELKDLEPMSIASHAHNFKKDRLSLDSRIPSDAISRFYSKWIENSFSFPNKTVYSLQSGLCITLWQKDSLKIDLVSVLDKRKGIGSRLVEHTLIKAAMEKVSSVEITTETHNEAAINIYIRNGFREKARTSCLHFFHHDKQKSD
jgi:hypothetical protein